MPARGHVPLDPSLAERIPLRILVAEDNPVNQKVMAMILERMGYRADLAADGAEVLEAVERQPYDLILMDVRMPDLDGIEATREIRVRDEINPQPVIIALTAGAMSLDRERCLEAGMDAYIGKPVRAYEIQDVLLRFSGGEELANHQTVPLPEVAAEADVIDQVLGELEAAADRGVVAEVIDTFLESGSDQVDAIRRAAAIGDAERIRQLAHTLRGGSDTLGARRLASLCRALEQGCLNGSLEGASALVTALDRELDRVRNLLLETRPS